jgi:flagellin-like protein
MNARKCRERRIRRRRAVSPLVATVLLIAIVLVLAAILFIVINNLQKGPSDPPLGSAFAWGNQIKFEAPATWLFAVNGCDYHHLCYNFEIAVASPGLRANNMIFGVANTLGAAQTFSGVSVLDPQGNLEAQYLPGAGWSTAAPAACPAGDTCWGSGPFAPGSAFVLDTGVLYVGGPSYSGFSLVAFGANGYNGHVAVQLQ